MSDLMRKNYVADSGEHVTPWLGAYLDNEVTARLRVQIEAHLGGCLKCQADLESLEQLSDLLHMDPPYAPRTSDAVFARQVVERITRPAVPWWQSTLQVGWRFAPLFIFAVWAFFQAVGWVSGMVLSGMQWFPGLENAFQVFAPFATTPDSALLSDLLRMGLLNPTVHEAAELVSWLEPASILIFLNLVFIGVLALLFISWLASWWAYHRSQA